MPVGQLSAPTQIAGNWLIYKVVGHEAVIPEDLAKQSAQIRQELLAGKQQAAFDAFRIALEDRLKAEGKFAINADAIKRVTRSS
jgi:hypothetical protein